MPKDQKKIDEALESSAVLLELCMRQLGSVQSMLRAMKSDASGEFKLYHPPDELTEQLLQRGNKPQEKKS